MNITLTEYELMQAALTGCMRFVSAKCRNYKETLTNYDDSWDNHLEGACGEVAVAKLLGKYWGGSVGTFQKQGDIDSCAVEVRTRRKHGWDLIIRDRDPDERVFVLVTGTAPNYRVCGWLHAGSAKQQQWRKDHGGYGAAYFVPQNALREMHELIEVLK